MALTLLLACTPPPVPEGPRIVSLHDTTTEIVVGLGRAVDLVAVMEPAFLSPEAAAATASVPRLGAPDGKLLLPISSAGSVLVYDTATHEELARFDGVGAYPWSVSTAAGPNDCH